VTASFTIGATTVHFGALVENFTDTGDPPFRQFNLRVLLRGGLSTVLADWEELLTLRSRVSTRAVPGGLQGSEVYDVGNGFGLGTLTVAALGSGTAYLTSLQLERDLPNRWRIGRSTFQIVSWTPP
jgi:hypothetical protein